MSPNLRWEYRYRLLRLIGHTLALLLFVWLAIGLRASFGHNSDYLDAIGRKVQALTVTWPGPRGGVHAEITANPRIRPDTSTIVADGPWALMRLLQKGRVVDTATPGRTRVAFSFDGRQAALDVASTGSVANPLTSDVLKTFRCPSTMSVFNLPDSGPPPGLPRGMLPASAGSASH